MKPTPKYLAKYNGYVLPGYVQEESINSPVGISDHPSIYSDASLSEYTGLANRTLSVRLKVWDDTFDIVRNRIQTAATYLRENKQDFVPLYLQYTDRHYQAMTQKIQTPKEVGSSLRLRDYTVDFEIKPYLYGEVINTMTGTSQITTDAVTRTFSNGTWTPAGLILSGTNITVSGYTDTEFTGFLSIDGAVSSLYIDSENYTATIVGSGGSSNNALNRVIWADFAIYVGPGKTTFDITGATSCTISYSDRWLL